MDDFVPVNSPQKHLIESLLWHLHSEGVCCVVSELFPADQAGRFKQLCTGLNVECPNLRLFLQYGTNYKYFTLREFKFTALSPDIPGGYRAEDHE